MQIKSLLTGRPDPTAFARNEPAEPAKGKRPASALGDVGSPNPRDDALRSIVAEYSVTEISPRAFSEMLQRLRQAGALSEKDLQELAAVRADLDQAGVGADDEIDLVRFYSDRVRKAEQLAAQSGDKTSGQDADRLRTRLAWLSKFAILQSSPEPSRIDAAA